MKLGMTPFALAIPALVMAVPALAGPAQGYLYGIDVPGNLFRIDLSTGEGTPVGGLPGFDGELIGYNEIEFDNLAMRAWAQQRDGNFQDQEFDITDGTGIGDPVYNSASWHGLEFIGGVLYGAGFAFDAGPERGGPGDGDASLGILDPETGEYDIVGNFGLGSYVITGLAYNGSTLYGISNASDLDRGLFPDGSSGLYEINMQTGVASIIGYTGIRAGSLKFGPDGNLYAGGVSDWAGDLYRINPATGESTLVGATGFGTGGGGGGGGGNGISGLALVIPAPSAAGLLGVGALATLRRRRR